MRFPYALLLAVFLLLSPAEARAQAGSDEALAKQLANPISSLISVPFQYNYNCCFGPADGDQSLLNIQPVVPFQLNSDWNLIVRTILPVIDQQSPARGIESAFGLGDTTQSFFLSPRSSPNGVTWGLGPAFLWPTGTDDEIDSGKWGVGPTFVILKQQGGWTYGVLANQIWSYADTSGSADRPAYNEAFVQPFLAYTWPDTTTLTLNSESSFDWTNDEASIPLNLMVSHIYHLGKQPVSLGIGGRWYAETFDQGPDWGLRAFATFLFPAGG